MQTESTDIPYERNITLSTGVEVTKVSYVIIAGTTKSGTGSLFNYLADHPEICGSNIKETRFFFNQEYYSLPARYTFSGDLSQYSTFFSHCQGTETRLEATPDYLYSPTTPDVINEAIEDVKILFILREPVERMTSWFRFAVQQRLIDENMGYDSYVNSQLELSSDLLDNTIPQYYRTLEQGRYSEYLKHYLNTFDRSQLFVAGFSELKRDKGLLLSNIADFLGIDRAFYENYGFRIYNRTWTMRSAGLHRLYVLFRRSVRMRTHHNPRIWIALKRLRRKFEPLYLKLNTKEDEKVVISTNMKQTLQEYYGGELSAICTLLQKPDFNY